jgi:hypothetical protein
MGYLFEALDALEEVGYLNQTRRAKSVTLTEAGVEHGWAPAARFLGEKRQRPLNPLERTGGTLCLRVPPVLSVGSLGAGLHTSPQTRVR